MWDMWHVYGCGIDLGVVSDEKKLSFIKNHNAVAQSAGCNEEDLKNIFDDPEMFGVEMADIIAQIMSFESGVRFFACHLNEEGQDPIMFTPAYPWEFNDKERSLTRDELFDILKVYAEELGVGVDMSMDVVYSG